MRRKLTDDFLREVVAVRYACIREGYKIGPEMSKRLKAPRDTVNRWQKEARRRGLLDLRVAVLTLTRDRLDYTKHCFAKLRENAGIEYDHHVLDQGSQDGTREWLEDTAPFVVLCMEPENIGISRGMNKLLEFAMDCDYDVIVKFDNDCELTKPNTLRDICELVHKDGKSILSPRIQGLNNPPGARGLFYIGDETILDIPQIGGIFLAAPASVYETYRYPEDGPGWGLDDADICHWYRTQGGRCGYVTRLEANHYETTSGQHARYPDYFARTLAEGKPAL